ncbi:unnamed protein product [Caenorhabditis bovis]|uniref:Cilia- and flagella-associated protein 36 n=1 Tax=Caenorhabditis bovis TaxID=2654633 RepID=A0A8S1EEK9_9PELO|nr:unnamed protein product [Caenorhabditis bovis]
MLKRFSSKRAKNAEESEAKEKKKLLDKFLEFISSSIWNIPVACFIEDRSTVFDRQQMETEVYEHIHKEYSNLIDTLIECFCDDSGTTPQKLTEALKILDQQNLTLRQRVS